MEVGGGGDGLPPSTQPSAHSVCQFRKVRVPAMAGDEGSEGSAEQEGKKTGAKARGRYSDAGSNWTSAPVPVSVVAAAVAPDSGSQRDSGSGSGSGSGSSSSSNIIWQYPSHGDE